jgi:hypothetical protein
VTATLIRPMTLSTLATLTWYETRRCVRSPVLLAALALTAYAIYDLTRGIVADADELPTYPAGFIGGFGMIAACWLAQSMDRSAEALDVAPTPAHVRTTALCLTALVPFACGLLSLAAIVMFRRVEGDWTEGAFSTADRAAVLVSQVALPALGGPLLGIALGRWVHAGWVGPALFVIIVAWVLVANGLADTHRNSLPVLLMRMFAPFTFFTTWTGPGVETWRGLPVAFLGWQLCLCTLAVTVALLRDADLVVRRRLTDALFVLSFLAAATYTLAVTGGLHHAVITYPGLLPQPI